MEYKYKKKQYKFSSDNNEDKNYKSNDINNNLFIINTNIIKNINIYKYYIRIIIYILIIFFIIFIIINNLFKNKCINKNIKFILYSIKSNNEAKKITNYINKYIKNNIKVIKKYKKINIPKISIISPIFNRQRYILRLLKCIQSQNFNNIEIILIDDCSKDNSAKIIEEYQKIDKRVILIKNIKNKGTFVSRNLGVLYSKGNYLVLPDPDDVLTKNILKLCYKYSEKYNYEMIRFNMYTMYGKITMNEEIKNIENRPVYQPELSTYIFYGNNELEKIDYHICNKFVRKEAYIRGINFINKNYLTMYVIYRDDSMINYILYRASKSFYFLKVIGYYYFINSLSVTNNLFSKNILRIKFGFILLKIVFEYSKNTKYEKDMFNFLFTILNKLFPVVQKISSLKNDFKFYYETIQQYLSSKYLSKENKYILNSLNYILKTKIK